MASLRVLTFDHEGRPIQFHTWLDDLQLYLLSDSRDNVSLFDHTSGASLAPPATTDTHVSGQGREHYFLLVVDDYTRYTMVFRLRSRGEGILQSFMLPTSPHQKGIAEHRIGLVMEVTRTSMIHAAAPHFLWPFAVRYAVHQLNLWPHVSLSETSPTLRWTGKVGDASVFQFYHPTSRCVLPSQDITFDESVPFYHLFPYHSAPLPPPPLFLVPSLPSVDPLPPQGPAPSCVSQADPLPGTAPVEVTLDSGVAGGAAFWGAEPTRAEPGGAEPTGVERWGAESEGAGSGGAEPEGANPGGAKPEGAESGGAEPRGTGAGGTRATSLGGTGVLTGAGGPEGAKAAGPGGARTRGTGVAGAGGAGGAGAGGAGARDPGVRGTGVGGDGVGGTRAGGAGAGDPGAGGAGAGGAGAACAGAGDTGQPRSYFSQPPLQPASPLPAPSPYAEHTGGLTKRHEPMSLPALPVRAVCTGCRVPHQRPPSVPSTHHMALRPSSIPQRVPLPSPPVSSLADGPDPKFDLAHAVSPTVPHLLANVVTVPLFESAAASALVAELVDFAAACPLDYAASPVAESEFECPPSAGGECALGSDVLEDRLEDFECFAAAVPHLVSMLIAFEGDPDTPDIPTPRSYAEAITVPPPGANIVDGMWIFRLKWPPGSPTAFKARYGSLREEIWLRCPPGFTGSFPASTQWSLRRPVYGLRQAPREWHDKLRTALAVLGFAPSTADPSLFLRIDTSLPQFYVVVYVDDLVFATADTEALALVKSELQKRHTYIDLGELRSYLGLQITRDRARRTITLTQSHMVHQVLQRFGFRYSSPQSTPLPTGRSLSAPPSDESVEPSGPYPELVGCLMYLMTCTQPDLAYPLSILACFVAPGRHRPVHWEAAKRVLRYLCSTLGIGALAWRTGSNCEAGIYTGAMAAQELRWLTYLLTDLGEQPRSSSILYVDNKAMIALCQEHRIEHRTKHITLCYFLARELQQRGQLCLAYVATRANTADIFTKALQSGEHQRFCTVLGLVPTLPHLLTT
ncbi:unnamed protein product [Closterium sp. NIES-53]